MESVAQVDGDQPQWLDDIEATDLLFGADRDSALTTYIASFYFCSYTMTSVGYGDLGPKNIVERLICIFMVMSSGLCWAYVLGEVCAIVADFNAESQIFRKKMHHLNRTPADARGLGFLSVCASFWTPLSTGKTQKPGGGGKYSQVLFPPTAGECPNNPPRDPGTRCTGTPS